MAGLDTHLELPGLALPPDPVHPVQVAIYPIDLDTVHIEPGAAVHPRSPAAGFGHLNLATGQLGCQLAQSGGIQRRPVVQAEVIVGVGTVRLPRPATTKTHPNDAIDANEPVGDLHQAFHGLSLPNEIGHGEPLVNPRVS